ncbi:TRAP transporter permease [Desulfovibrio mangrovi]|uniref:TRAP transporter permease n=1 Tax=Desulfovibrio mangrovi TaxID=2976983 RepID=UPI0022453157|nr:TRAP transporter permease [Desulfovibrio mangrovi]UZP68085.1 TRAP transporter permease [Desulfovibrio mangrovi]
MRELSGWMRRMVYVYIVLIGVFHLYTAVFGAFEAYLQRIAHLSLVFPLAFWLYPATKRSPKDRVTVPDWILSLLSVIPGLYAAWQHDAITARIVSVDPLTTVQLVLGILLVFMLMEATRRVVGLPLMLVSAFFAGYMYFGHYFPGPMRGLSFSPEEIVEHLFLTDEGVFSIPLGVSATFVMVFLIFGGFLDKSGIGEYFMKFAQSMAGTTAGGPAKIAVLCSCLFGSISGSAVANVYGTGTFTIPLMKRLGYSGLFAGAVEAVASSGGQIMPPIMGAGAFIMASLLGLPYRDIIIAALLPALMYYGALFLMVHLRAKKRGLRSLTREELPPRREVLSKLWMLAPIVVLVTLLLSGFTAMLAAVVGIVGAWGVALPDARYRMGPKRICDAIYCGAKNIPVVAIACASAGIIVGAVSLTGIGFKFVTMVSSLANGVGFIALVLIMIVALVLGMGLPTVGAYILAAALGVPVLVKLGFAPLAAHLFVFYFAIVSAITPPVALAAYAASSLSGASPNATGFQAMQLGILAFIVPFAFCYDPGIILSGSLFLNCAAIIGGIAAVFAFGHAVEGYAAGPLALWQKFALVAGGGLSLTPHLYGKAAGVLVVTGLLFTWYKAAQFKETACEQA